MTLGYPLILTPDDNGTLLVTCPDLPEVTTFGEDEADALRHARDAIEEALAARIAHGREIPQPRARSKIVASLPTQTALKVCLYRTLQDQKITRAELSRRLHWRREQVDRLFRLGHATRLDQFDAAFRALGREVRLSIE
ncbi:MAG: type II toxin-antitoxin system HicB family antitoxin [Methyloceanibacter sp.]